MPTPRRLLPPTLARAVSSVLGPLIGLLLVVAIFGTLNPAKFFSGQNFDNVLKNNFHYAVAAVGMTFVIVTAGIDLSVGSTMALSCVFCVKAIQGVKFPPADARTTLAVGAAVGILVGLCAAGRLSRRGGRPARTFALAAACAAGAGAAAAGLWLVLAGHALAPMPLAVGVLVGIAAGATVGLVNGSLVTSLDLPPFVVTLATLGAVRGLALLITDGVPIRPDPSWPDAARATMDTLRTLHAGEMLGLAPSLWVTLGVAAIAVPLLHFTVVGRYAYAIGSSERTARLCGVNVERYKCLCYVIAGTTAGLAGVMMAAKFTGAQPTEFAGDELTIIAAVVIGGTSLFGGEGTVVGTLLGILMLALLSSGCNVANMSGFVQPIFIGYTIVLAASLDRFRHMRS